MRRNRLDINRATIYNNDDYEADGRDFLSTTILERDDGPSTINTGLLDQDGNPITRRRERKRIGFVNF
jgi:hypothetical protein